MRGKDLIGQIFGKLTVLSQIRKENSMHFYWNCRCECGNNIVVRSSHLRSGNTKSCGCIKKEYLKANKLGEKHGAYLSKLYAVWEAMRQRCKNPTAQAYKNYGGRGISVCNEWNDFQKFEAWALSHGYKEGLSIDRIDNDGDYCPENCQWLTRAENASKGSGRAA